MVLQSAEDLHYIEFLLKVKIADTSTNIFFSMSMSLTPKQKHFIQNKLQAGKYRSAEEVLEIDFHLPFSISKSEMDEFEEKNLLTGGIAKLAKKISNVQSEYFVEAEAIVEGVALNPFDKQLIELK